MIILINGSTYSTHGSIYQAYGMYVVVVEATDGALYNAFYAVQPQTLGDYGAPVKLIAV
jgi:hypothetical protein